MKNTDTGSHANTPLARYWRRTQRLTLALLGLWFGATFVTVFFARQLDHLNLFGWPLSFYMAAQGMALVYLAIVAAYTIGMRRAERRLHREQSDGD